MELTVEEESSNMERKRTTSSQAAAVITLESNSRVYSVYGEGDDDDNGADIPCTNVKEHLMRLG